MTTDTSVQTAIQNYFDALAAGDPARLRACFTDDASWIAPGRLPNSGTWVGPQAIVDEFFPIAIARMVPGTFQTSVISITFGEENAVLEWESTAELVSGKHYRGRYIANVIVRQSQIAEVREYFDTQNGELLFQE